MVYQNALVGEEHTLHSKYYKKLNRKRSFLKKVTADGIHSRLTKFFALPDVPYRVKFKIAREWDYAVPSRIWRFRNLHGEELERIAEEAPPETVEEAEAFVSNPASFEALDNERALSHAPFVYALCGYHSDRKKISREARYAIINGAIDAGVMNMEIAHYLFAFNATFHKNIIGVIWDEPVLQWARDTYGLEAFPDSFIIDFIYPAEKEGLRYAQS